MIAAGDLSAAEVTECANIIRAQVDRITAIVRQLLDFARRRPTKKSPTDMAGLVTGTLKLLSTIGGKQNVSLEYTGEERAVRARVDAGQIQQVLMNIILNAVQAMPGGGAVRVDMRSTVARPPEGHEGAEGRYLRISVRDEGAGISPEHLPHIFEPFFTTKDVGKGSGLGLSIAYGIVREHGGWIDVQSEVGVGSCFDVYLPLEDEQCPDGS
jgi:signal transduction histidine kinase